MKRKVVTIILCLLLCLSLLAGGCGNKYEGSLQPDELLSVGGHICPWSEAQIFILSQYAQYSRDYGEGIWSVALSEGSFADRIKSALLPYLELLFLADLAAEKEGITLSENEKFQIERAASDYYRALNEATKEKLGLELKEAEDAFSRYARGQLFYEQTLINGRIEISEEEARVMSVQIVAVDQLLGMGTAQEIRSRLEGGDPVNAILSEYVKCGTFREDLIRGRYGGNFDTIVFSLKNDQWSPIITLGDSFYIVKCLSSYLPAETARNKAEMEQQAREELLSGVLDKYSAETTLLFNPTLWDSWSIADYADCSPVSFYDYASAFSR